MPVSSGGCPFEMEDFPMKINHHCLIRHYGFSCQTPNIWGSWLCRTHRQTHFGLLKYGCRSPPEARGCVAEPKSPIGLFPNILGFRISYLSLLVISKQSTDKDIYLQI